MAFLNNAGDIILDAVLTDTGRMRLAKGDGSFKIAKFALGDDEIDYSLFNSDASTALQDLQILQTPVLEAFTNNASSMKSKLLTINLKNLLYLPVMKINDKATGFAFSSDLVTNGFVVAVDKNTEDKLNNVVTDYIKGFTRQNKKIIRVDQGLDTTSGALLDASLIETQYIIETDNRLCSILDGMGSTELTPTYIDDDDIASYFLIETTDTSSVSRNPVSPDTTGASQVDQVIAGARGTILKFSVQASTNLQSSQFLFDKLGVIDTSLGLSGTTKVIFSNINVVGVTTGYSTTVPLAFVKVI